MGDRRGACRAGANVAKAPQREIRTLQKSRKTRGLWHRLIILRMGPPRNTRSRPRKVSKTRAFCLVIILGLKGPLAQNAFGRRISGDIRDSFTLPFGRAAAHDEPDSLEKSAEMLRWGSHRSERDRKSIQDVLSGVRPRKCHFSPYKAAIQLHTCLGKSAQADRTRQPQSCH